ncbi:MAG: putative transport system permease protein [Solirubrobacteraceae bacterium]|jgi:putative ABC transport system permease protein|nr:putative transport system permease protein [Solirubrobacteraceae bacterium]
MKSRLLARDLVRLASIGLRTRRLRAVLSALGIAIGIASMVAVLGISQSSKQNLLDRLDKLGTNLLTAAPGQSFFGENATMPSSAPAAIRGMPSVQTAAATSSISATVRRTDRIPAEETGGIALLAAEIGLPRAAGATMARGRFLDAALERYPAVVLGAVTAQRLGIDRVGVQVYASGHWLAVVGIMRHVPLVPDLDRAALIGYPAAKTMFGTDRHAGTLYVRAQPDAVTVARNLIPPSANPEHPEEIDVSRPSDALAARAAAKGAFTALFLGLGAVALLVGGVGIANVMVISVLERRSEVGLRRALGARRRHVAAQFFAEALLLSVLGGVAGVALGALVTGGYAAGQGWRVVVPASAAGGGLAAALLIGAVAGLYPALRATRLSPTEALRST